MATERLSSILSHLTPTKSGLSAMYAAFSVLSPSADHYSQQNPEERRRCSHYTRYTDAPDQSLQRRHEGYSARFHRLPAAQEGRREVKYRPTDGRGHLSRKCQC